MYTLLNIGYDENIKVEIVPNKNSQVFSSNFTPNNPEIFQVCLNKKKDDLNRQQGFIDLPSSAYDLFIDEEKVLNNSNLSEILKYLQQNENVLITTPKTIESNGIEINYKR